MAAIASGFDWDGANRAKCQQHGVLPAEVEALFDRPVLIVPDHDHSQSEERMRAIGKTASGRSVFLVFTIRARAGKAADPTDQRSLHAPGGGGEL